jgi:hypothetical protein
MFTSKTAGTANTFHTRTASANVGSVPARLQSHNYALCRQENAVDIVSYQAEG